MKQRHFIKSVLRRAVILQTGREKVKHLEIVRVLNTNAVVTADEKGHEIIVTGPGIGFKKKKGEKLEEELVDKVYKLQRQEDIRRLQEVVRGIDEKYLDIAARTIKEAREGYDLKVNDVLYITLTDHINSAVERYEEGIPLKNMMLLDIRRFYPKEYKLGLRAVKRIQKISGIDLGDDEAGFIAMHIISAQMGDSGVNVQKITELINSILQIVRIYFKLSFDEDSITYQRFVTHLKFFAERLFQGKPYKESMQEIYEALVEQNEYAFLGVQKIEEFVSRKYGHTLNADEQLYLLIHIKRILDEEQESSN